MLKKSFIIIAVILSVNLSWAEEDLAFRIPRIEIGIDEARGPGEISLALQILFLITVLALVPSIIIMVTSFVRVLIVFSFVRQALALQMLPPQQVITALALFLTIYIMSPTLMEMHRTALQPFMKEEITFGEALSRAEKSIREFMFKYTREKDIALFLHLSKLPRPKTKEDVPTYVLIPSFMISELTTGFQMGLLLFVPFVLIDMVVASVLMSMGMIMLPPIMISLPFKVLLFVMVDGWNLLTRSIILSFQ
jgi:flagellar biosynthetic protein FliP